MPKLDYRDHRRDPAGWARELGISREAVEVYLAGDVLDLHVDSFIWDRVFGYDLRRRHGRGWFGGRFYSQVDFPRIREAALGGATWVITTNPFRPASSRPETFLRNLERLRGLFASVDHEFAVVRSAAEYRVLTAETGRITHGQRSQHADVFEPHLREPCIENGAYTFCVVRGIGGVCIGGARIEQAPCFNVPRAGQALSKKPTFVVETAWVLETPGRRRRGVLRRKSGAGARRRSLPTSAVRWGFR